MTMRLRRFWLTIHRWLGLTLGALFVLIGLSGSLLVFQHAIDERLHPKLLRSVRGGDRRSLNEVVAAAERAAPGAPARAHFVEPPRGDGGVWTVWFQRGPDKETGFVQIYVNPWTAEATGRRVWGEFLTTWAYRLHYQLLAGPTGETAVGVAGLFLTASLGTGLWLWLPLWKNSWRAAFAVRGGRRFNYDLHKTVGIVSALVLLMSCCTGVCLIFPEWIKPLAAVVSTESVPNPKALRSKPRAGLVRIDADQAAAVARSVFPGGEMMRLQFPARAVDPYVVRVRRAGEVRRSSGNSRVWIDQYSGEVLAVRDWNRRTLADAFFGWQFPLHNGEAFGLTGRWIVFAAGLTPGILYVTGFVLWRRKRSSPARSSRRAQAFDDAAPAAGAGEPVASRETPALGPKQPESVPSPPPCE